MRLSENPIVRRELRRLRFWEGRRSLSVMLGALAGLAGLMPTLLCLVGFIDLRRAHELLIPSAAVLYLLVTVSVIHLVTTSIARERRTGLEEDLHLTLLTWQDIEWGRIISAVLAPLLGAAVACLSLAVIPTIALVYRWHADSAAEHVFRFATFPLLGAGIWLLVAIHLLFCAVFAAEEMRGRPSLLGAEGIKVCLMTILLGMSVVGLVVEPIIILVAMPRRRRRVRRIPSR